MPVVLCPRCGGRMIQELDGEHHCLNCGYYPTFADVVAPNLKATLNRQRLWQIGFHVIDPR